MPVSLTATLQLIWSGGSITEPPHFCLGLMNQNNGMNEKIVFKYSAGYFSVEVVVVAVLEQQRIQKILAKNIASVFLYS